MDGFRTLDQVLIIAATNRVETLDEALLRPGRFDRRIYMGNPSTPNRFLILKARNPLHPPLRCVVIIAPLLSCILPCCCRACTCSRTHARMRDRKHSHTRAHILHMHTERDAGTCSENTQKRMPLHPHACAPEHVHGHMLFRGFLLDLPPHKHSLLVASKPSSCANLPLSPRYPLVTQPSSCARR